MYFKACKLYLVYWEKCLECLSYKVLFDNLSRKGKDNIISSDFTCKSRKGRCVLQSAGQFDLQHNHINFVFYQVYSRVKVVKQLNPGNSNVREIPQPTKYSD